MSLAKVLGSDREGNAPNPRRNRSSPLDDEARVLSPRLLAGVLGQSKGHLLAQLRIDGLRLDLRLAEDSVAPDLDLHLSTLVAVDPDEELRKLRVLEAVGDTVAAVFHHAVLARQVRLIRYVPWFRHGFQSGIRHGQLHVDAGGWVYEVVVPDHRQGAVDATLAPYEGRQDVAEVLDLVVWIALRDVERLTAPSEPVHFQERLTVDSPHRERGRSREEREGARWEG